METKPNNVTQISNKQPAPAGAKFIITAVVEGFPIQVEVVDANADKLRAMIDRLKAIGAEPPQARPAATQGQGAGEAKKAPPKCPVHNSPMKEGRRGFFCPRKDDDGYCDQTA